MRPLINLVAAFSLITVAAASGPETIVETTDCLSCHSDKVLRKATHFLNSSDDCMLCHQGNVTPDEHSVVTLKIDTICFPCHASQAAFGINQSHVDILCTDCHDPHGSNSDRNFVTDASGHCSEDCHDSQQLGLSHPIGPDVMDKSKGTSMSCVSTCHSIHNAKAEKNLQLASTDLCYQCHGEKF